MLIAELEQKSGLSRDTIRFYEHEKLITAPRRRSNGYREYDLHTVVELRFIAAGREIGFTLDEIREAIPTLKQPPAHCTALIKKLAERRTGIRAAIALERKRLRRIDELIKRFSHA
jgi:MerR family transcriptional regulator, copper efflux regulator